MSATLTLASSLLGCSGGAGSALEEPVRFSQVKEGATILGDYRTAVLLVGFDGTPNAFDGELLREAIFGEERSANAFFKDASRGKARLVGAANIDLGDVLGPFNLALTGCPEGNYAEVGRQAREAATERGVNLSPYDRIVYYFAAGAPNCPQGAAAGGSHVFLFGTSPEKIWDIATHELGHTFGLAHAARYTDCIFGSGTAADPLVVGQTCSHDERGDPSDIMGRRNFLLSSFHLERLGWLEPANVLVLRQSAVVVLVPIEVTSPAVQSLRIPRGRVANDTFLHFEYRQPLGADRELEDSMTAGVLVRLVSDPEMPVAPHLLDMTPGSQPLDADILDAPLPVGGILRDGPLQVRLVEANAERAILDVLIEDVTVLPPPEREEQDAGFDLLSSETDRLEPSSAGRCSAGTARESSCALSWLFPLALIWRRAVHERGAR